MGQNWLLKSLILTFWSLLCHSTSSSTSSTHNIGKHLDSDAKVIKKIFYKIRGKFEKKKPAKFKFLTAISTFVKVKKKNNRFCYFEFVTFNDSLINNNNSKSLYRHHHHHRHRHHHHHNCYRSFTICYC